MVNLPRPEVVNLIGASTVKNESKPKLLQFHEKISKLRFLDPACGCGNFLIIAYRELRLLEIEIIKVLLFKYEKLRPEVAAEAGYNVGLLIKCDVDKFYGIEYEEFPAQIAQVAMWLIDHQMNQLITQTFGEYYVRLPLKKNATIVHGNALSIEWNSLLQADEKYSYILGNPPFIGSKFMTESQRADMAGVTTEISSIGLLDYVAAWYIKATHLINNTTTKAAFVSTNSIIQGEQVAILWSWLIPKGIEISFAHRTFQWSNEAKGIAAVHCVIIGFQFFKPSKRIIYDYKEIKGEPFEIEASLINPYLIDYQNTLVLGRAKPLCNVPSIANGSIPADGGNLLFSKDEKEDFISKEKMAAGWIRPYVGAEDFINGNERYCLWLKECPPTLLRQMPLVLKRVDAVREMREASTKAATRQKALTPTIFTEDRQPADGFYLAIPRTSSVNRKYIPLGFLSSNVIAANDLQIIPNATQYHFGILMSVMHMQWVKYTSGRLKSDYRYSVKYTYNTFPWPENPSEKQVSNVITAVEEVLQARDEFESSNLADLYNFRTMPTALVKAHHALDRAVDLCYRPQTFPNETKRIEFLFELYDKYTAGLFVKYKTETIK